MYAEYIHVQGVVPLYLHVEARGQHCVFLNHSPLSHTPGPLSLGLNWFFSILWLLGLCLGIVSLPRLYRSPYVFFWRFYSFMGFKIFYLLVMDIMCLDPIHPIFSSLPEPTQHPKVTFPSQLHVQISSLPSPSFFLFSFTTTEFVQCCLYVHLLEHG